MLARAIVVQRRGRPPGAGKRDCRIVIARPMRPAFQRILVQPGARQHRRRKLDMRRLAPVRCAGERQFPVAEAERIRRAALHQRQRLDRLHRRARKHRLRDVADLEQQLAVASHTATAPRCALSTCSPRNISTRTGLVTTLPRLYWSNASNSTLAQSLVRLAVRDIGEQYVVDQQPVAFRHELQPIGPVGIRRLRKKIARSPPRPGPIRR